MKKLSKERFHQITAGYLFGKDQDREYPSCKIKGKFAYFFKKDWDYDWDKYPKGICYCHKPPDKYRFLGYCLDKYAFKIVCKGKKCNFVHD